MGATRDGDFDAATFAFRKDDGYVFVEGVGFGELVGHAGVGVFGFEWWGRVRVDPKRPEGVVEIEDQEGRERMGVGEGGGRLVGCGSCLVG